MYSSYLWLSLLCTDDVRWYHSIFFHFSRLHDLSFSCNVDGAAMRAGVQTGDRIIKVMIIMCQSSDLLIREVDLNVDCQDLVQNEHSRLLGLVSLSPEAIIHILSRQLTWHLQDVSCAELCHLLAEWRIIALHISLAPLISSEIIIMMWPTLPFKSLQSVQFLKELSYAHYGCKYLLKNTVK